MIQVKNIISAALLSLVLAVSASAQDSRYFLHTVTKGQGLYSIARMYGVTEDEIIKLNPGSEKVIRTGQELRIPQKQEKAADVRFHTIAKGETLYRLSVENRVSVKEICDANPGLSAQNFKVGQVITIPAASDQDPLASTLQAAGETLQETTRQAIETLSSDTVKFKCTHVVGKRETIFKITRQYGITQAEFLDANPEFRYTKLRQGAVVNIPFTAQELAERSRQRQDAITHFESIPDSTLFAMNDVQEAEQGTGKVKAALLLPFALDDSISEDRSKMTEFYRGMLLAIDRLKNENISVDLDVIDCLSGSMSLSSVLESESMKDVDIVFGPKNSSQIAQVADWAEQNRKRLVLPFNRNDDEVYDNPYVFQLNATDSYFHQEIYDHFLKQFPNPNIIILDAQEFSKNEFISGLKRTAADKGIPYTTIAVDTASQTIFEALDTIRQNIFIINSSKSEPLNTMLPVLQLLTRNKSPRIETHLFGYPEYQIYASDHLEEMYEVDTYFYSWFYTNNMLQEAIDFGTSFRRAFTRQMMVSYPGYAPYGYDAGYYFLKGIATYGAAFENHLDDFETDPVQMGFKFERINNWGGFINRKVFFVHFSKDCKVEKIDFDK